MKKWITRKYTAAGVAAIIMTSNSDQEVFHLVKNVKINKKETDNIDFEVLGMTLKSLILIFSYFY